MSAAARKIVPKPKALNCPKCGAAIELRALGAAATVVCSYCSSTLDATDPQLKILQRWEAQITVQPLIPMGQRGKLKDTIWEVIGFQQRGITVEGTVYYWQEYVLFNPYKGFRYLTEYQGHWNYVTPVQSLPVMQPSARPRLKFQGADFDHFQSAYAITYFVIGEFPWRVKVGETVNTADYVCPPKSLSSESTDDEVTWSLGEYIEGKELWAAFRLPGNPPQPIGIYSNQPAPGGVPQGRPWKFFGLMAALLFAMMIAFAIAAKEQKVLEKSFVFNPGVAGEKSVVTDVFEIPGNKGNVEVEVRANLNNNWAFFAMALINEETGQAYDFGSNVSYYSGVDGGESWSEGSKSDNTTLPSIPGGKYYLRIEPDNAPEPGSTTPLIPTPIEYTVTVTRDVPFYFRYFLGIILLLIPLPFLGRKGRNFEIGRWSESDYGMPPGKFANAVAASDSSGDDD